MAGVRPPALSPRAFPSPFPGDPGAPVMTSGGYIRQQDPLSGSLFISLPSGLVLSAYSNGSVQAFDSRSLSPLPAQATPVHTPGGGDETRYQCVDALGNQFTFFSKSLDFSATSRDGRVRQVVYPSGQMLIMSRLPGADGRDVTHYTELLPDGSINTYGDNRTRVASDRIVYGTGQMVGLPYPIPVDQPLLGTMTGLSGRAMAQFPVSGVYPCPDPQAFPSVVSPLNVMGMNQQAAVAPWVRPAAWLPRAAALAAPFAAAPVVAGALWGAPALSFL